MTNQSTIRPLLEPKIIEKPFQLEVREVPAPVNNGTGSFYHFVLQVLLEPHLHLTWITVRPQLGPKLTPKGLQLAPSWGQVGPKSGPRAFKHRSHMYTKNDSKKMFKIHALRMFNSTVQGAIRIQRDSAVDIFHMVFDMFWMTYC